MGPHRQGMAGEADLGQPGFEARIHGISVSAGGLQQAVADIGAPGQQLFLDAEIALGVEEDHALAAHRQQRDGRIGAEASFAGDHPLCAMAGGQGHLPAGMGRGMGRAAIGHGGA